jgi:hypothetical protein
LFGKVGPKFRGTNYTVYSGCHLFLEDGGNSEMLTPPVPRRLGAVELHGSNERCSSVLGKGNSENLCATQDTTPSLFLTVETDIIICYTLALHETF